VAALAIALFAVTIATLLRWLLTPFGLPSTPFITYLPAVLVATLFGGLLGGTVATVASAVMAWFAFTPPEISFQFNGPEVLSLVLFGVVSSNDAYRSR
jgi:K+-sensing histidine kinase KdpD